MRSRNSGFTLIELIVALTVMVMVTTVAFAGFRVGLNAWERGTKFAERLEQRAIVERLIRRQLPLAMPANVFRGTTDHLEFVSDYSFVDGQAGFRKIDYVARDGQFLYGEQSVLEYAPAEPVELPTTVLAKFNRISFEYYGEEKGKAVWMKEWNEKEMPPAVRIKLDDDTFYVFLVNRK